MDQCNKIEQQQYIQNRQTIMKKEKKTENRLKFKFTINALEKARTFFRSLDLKYHHRHEQSPPPPPTTTTDLVPSNENNEKKEIVLNSIPPTTTISTTKISRVEKFNPEEISNDNKLPSNYFQQKYKQYLKPSLLIPKQYYNELLTKRYQTYSNIYTKHNLYSRSPVSTLNPNLRYHIRPFICHEIESSSMLKWNQCVRRLNREYHLTIEALQQAKQCLEQIYFNSKSKYETKKNVNVTFCLPSSSSSSSYDQIESTKNFKPKFVKPILLNTFVSSELSIHQNEDKFDSIATIIQKFNDLCNQQSIFDHSKNKSEQEKEEKEEEEEETTYTVETIYKNDFLSSSLNNENIVIIQENTPDQQFNLVKQPILEKSKYKSISRIPIKYNSSLSYTKLKQSLTNNNYQSSNHVKSIIQQINSSSHSTPYQQTYNKNIIQIK